MPSFSILREDIFQPGPASLVSAALDELNRRYGGDSDTAHLDNEEMAPPRGGFFVARSDAGHLAGGVGLRSIVDPDLHLGEIKRLWVRPDLRQAGVARGLMAAVENYARDCGYAQLFLETGWAQPEAQAFYQRIGWTRIDDFPEGAFSYPLGIKFTRVF